MHSFHMQFTLLIIIVIVVSTLQSSHGRYHSHKPTKHHHSHNYHHDVGIYISLPPALSPEPDDPDLDPPSPSLAPWLSPSHDDNCTPSNSSSSNSTPSNSSSNSVSPSSSPSNSVSPSSSPSNFIAPSPSLNNHNSTASNSGTGNSTSSNSTAPSPLPSYDNSTPGNSCSNNPTPSNSGASSPSPGYDNSTQGNSSSNNSTPGNSGTSNSSPSSSAAPSPSPSNSVSASPSQSNSVSPSTSPSNSVSPSTSPSNSISPSPSPSNSLSPSPSPSNSVSPSPSPSNSVSPSPAPSSSVSPSPSPSPSMTVAPSPSPTFHNSAPSNSSSNNSTPCNSGTSNSLPSNSRAPSPSSSCANSTPRNSISLSPSPSYDNSSPSNSSSNNSTPSNSSSNNTTPRNSPAPSPSPSYGSNPRNSSSSNSNTSNSTPSNSGSTNSSSNNSTAGNSSTGNCNSSTPVMFDVRAFGAIGNGSSDDTKAFRSAWKAACAVESAVLLVPADGVFMVTSTVFLGPCQPGFVFQIDGVLMPPDGPNCWPEKDSKKQWIVFYRADGMTLKGEGTIEGNGESWWNLPCKPHRGPNGSTLPGPCDSPALIRFFMSNNVTVKDLRIENSPQFHIKFDGCNGVQISGMLITSPVFSPNTDGIHIENTTTVEIYNSKISNGDDCISIGTGCADVHIENVTCRSGHGISIGSLGERNSRACVSNITVRNAMIHDSDNGVRIKTWQGGTGSVSNINFDTIFMENVRNCITIDQYYCLTKQCTNQTSAVYVSDVSYTNIKGTYDMKSSPVHFACSDTVACTNITMSEVELLPYEGEMMAEPFCWNAYGISETLTIPPIYCLQDGRPQSLQENLVIGC